MAARRKERPLSPEELKEKLIQQNRPHWLHGEPMCALAPDAMGIPQIFPLAEETSEELLLIFLLDAAAFHMDETFKRIHQWKETYRNLKWQPLVFFESKYQFLNSPRFFDRFKRDSSFHQLRLFVDPEGAWHRRFEASKLPKVLFVNRGKLIEAIFLEAELGESFEKIENYLQKTLRSEDAGLPLPDVSRLAPEFPQDGETISIEKIAENGNWQSFSGSFASDDSQAALSFLFEGAHLRIACTTHPSARENTRALVLLDEMPLPGTVLGNDLHINDKGQCVWEINRSNGIYELVTSSKIIKGMIKVKFINAVENPVVFHEFKTSSSILTPD